jgi:ABC-type multidrug transport system ATPase subunit
LETIISIKDLTKKLQNVIVFKDLNLTINRGEIMAIVGPSGSGKTTLLKCLNRLIEPDSGTIFFEGENVNNFSPVELRRNLMYVHQESVMLTGSIFDNLSFGPSLLGEVDKNHILECLKDVGLSEDFLDRDASKLSGGEKRRVALARALALRPKVLLLDEPTTGADPKNVEKIENTIINFSKNRKLTVLWVTHYVEQAKRVSDRIANLKNGIIRETKDTVDFKWEEAY